MKLTHYLRGLGIGILVTTVVISVASAGKGDSLSDEEIIQRAKALGMTEESVVLSQLGDVKGVQEELPEGDAKMGAASQLPDTGAEPSPEGQTADEAASGTSSPTNREAAGEAPSGGAAGRGTAAPEGTPEATPARSPEPSPADTAAPAGGTGGTARPTGTAHPTGTVGPLTAGRGLPAEDVLPENPPSESAVPAGTGTNTNTGVNTDTGVGAGAGANTDAGVSAAAGADTDAGVSAGADTGAGNNNRSIEIYLGEGSDAVSRKLEAAGLVQSAADCDAYLVDNRKDRSMQAGTHLIPIGSSMEEIAKIITGK